MIQSLGNMDNEDEVLPDINSRNSALLRHMRESDASHLSLTLPADTPEKGGKSSDGITHRSCWTLDRERGDGITHCRTLKRERAGASNNCGRERDRERRSPEPWGGAEHVASARAQLACNW